MKDDKSKKDAYSRRSFIKSVTLGGGALCLLGMANTLTAQHFEVFSEANKAKDLNKPIGSCQCGGGPCGGGGGGGECKCGGGPCSGSGG